MTYDNCIFHCATTNSSQSTRRSLVTNQFDSIITEQFRTIRLVSLNDETNIILALSPLLPIFVSSVDLFHLLKFTSICISPQSICLIAFSPIQRAPYGALLFLTDKLKVNQFCLLNICNGDWNKTMWHRAGLWCHPFFWSKGGWTNERA